MPELPEVDAVFWDIGGVILSTDSMRTVHRSFVESLCSTHETPHSPDDALDRWREAVGGYFRERDGTTFRPAREAYRLAVDEILSVEPAETDWQDAFRKHLSTHVAPNPDAIEAIERLAGAPLHQGVISDVDDDEGERLLSLFGVRDSMDSYTSSEEVGRTKPDPAMFETALEKAGVDPERAVMVGDRYEHDVAGAAAVGMTPVAYGAENGPAVEIRLDDLRDLPGLLGVEE